MKKRVSFGLLMLSVIVLSFINSCKPSNIDLSSMSDKEKQALLEEIITSFDGYNLDKFYKKPILIPTNTKDKIYCIYNCSGNYSSYDLWGNHILCYNIKTKIWNVLIPMAGRDFFETEDSNVDDWYPFMGIEQYKIVSNRLYVQYITGACGGPGRDYIVYYLDVIDDTWHFVVTCGDCEMSGNRIKAEIWWMTKDRGCGALNEYADSIKWINMD